MAKSKNKETAEAVETAPKKRGAPKGVKRGPRQLFFAVLGLKSDGSPILDSIPATAADEAKASFAEMHGIDASKVLGPFYEYQGKGASKSSVSIDIGSLRFTGLTKVGQHRGWNCRVMLTEDETIGLVAYTTPINPEDVKSARSKPHTVPLALREIENLTDEA